MLDSPSSFSLPSLLAAEVYEVVDPSDESEADALICPPVGGGPEPYQPPQPAHKYVHVFLNERRASYTIFFIIIL